MTKTYIAYGQLGDEAKTKIIFVFIGDFFFLLFLFEKETTVV